jgi:amidase
MSIALLPAVEQLTLLRNGSVSALELAEEHLARIARLNPTLKALVEVDEERVREQARRPAAGRLAGLPLTIKSSIEVEGHRCEIGSHLYAGATSSRDADAVASLRAEGAIILGTTNCPELLMAYDCENELYGRTSNPWDLDRTPGGSSGGEAAAIAAGLSAGGLGSDSGGSVRTPAHFSGICAFKPTSGRIPSRGHSPACVGPFSTLGSLGPMARTMQDVSLLFDVVGRPSPIDPSASPYRHDSVSLEEARQVSIGWFEDDGRTPVTDETRACLQQARRALEANGFRLVPFRPEALEEARRLWHLFFVQCGAMFYEPVIAGHEEQLTPTFRGFLKIARSQPSLEARQLLQAWADLDTVRARMLEQMQSCPVLLLPVAAGPAWLHGERSWSLSGQQVDYLDYVSYTQWFNLLGSPAAVVPVDRSAQGLPIGVQVAGLPHKDELVLTIAGVLDREFGYRVPPLS